MEHFFNLLLNLVTTALVSPIGLVVTFSIAFSGELGVSPPAVLEAAFVATGVHLVHGSFTGLALFPVVMAAAMLGTSASFWLTQRGVGLLLRFARLPEWAKGIGFLGPLPRASSFTVALLRQLPASQLPLTALWATMGSQRRPLLQGVALSVPIHGSALVIIGAASGRLLRSSGHAFVVAFALSIGDEFRDGGRGAPRSLLHVARNSESGIRVRLPFGWRRARLGHVRSPQHHIGGGCLS